MCTHVTPPPPSAAASASPTSPCVLASEREATFAMIRHTSGLRFLMLPMFFTASGLLAREHADARALRPLTELGEGELAWAGLGLSLGFLCFEALLSRNLRIWWAALGAKGQPTGSPALAHRPGPATLAARAVVMAPYPIAIAYWLRAETFGNDALAWLAVLLAAVGFLIATGTLWQK